MTPEELQRIFSWCKEHPSSTLKDAQRHFFPDARKYKGHTWVLLRYANVYAAAWEQRLLLTDHEYEMLSSQVLHLGAIAGKHSDVEAEWSELEEETTTDSIEIAAKMQEGNTIRAHKSHVCEAVLSDLEDAYTKFMGREYLRKQLDKCYPPGPNRVKPNTNLIEQGKFASKRFQKLMRTSCDELHAKGLYDAVHQEWQLRMVQFIDETFGGTSAILSVEQPWFEL